METILKVNGMHCEGCENRIKNVLSTFEDIKEVDANHSTKEVKIKSDKELDLNSIKEAIEDLGFEVEETK